MTCQFRLIIYLLVLPFAGILLSTPNPACALQLPAAAIATASPQATEAGHSILRQGGNAFDAAIAVTASLAVVEPMSSGIGGGGLWLLHREKDQLDIMIDGREQAPKAASQDMYLDKSGNVIPHLSMDGPLSAAIPGVPASIVFLAKKYGRLPLKTSLQPAIEQARKGFKVTRRYQRLAQFRLEVLRQSPAAAKIFLHNSEVPQLGYLIKQPDLANTLELIARDDKENFYHGKFAKKLVAGVQKDKGIWTTDDLMDYQVKERKPIRGKYKNITITSAAPPSSGGVALVTMLNILSGYDLNRLDSAAQKHLVVEAMRRAYRDRSLYLGDPDFVKIPVSQLLDPNYAEKLRESIRLDKATPSDALPGNKIPPKAQHTTHFSIIDQDGNRVAATLTINYPFGSGFVVPGTGVLLNDEMDDFSSKPGSPNAYGLTGGDANAIQPQKRPLSSMTPTFAEDKRGILVLGTPGGSRIITMVLLGILDYANGGTPKSIVALPRYHHQYMPDYIQYEESAFTDEELDRLQGFGHKFKLLDSTYGNMQAVMWDKQRNQLYAASDPRGEGAAKVQSDR